MSVRHWIERILDRVSRKTSVLIFLSGCLPVLLYSFTLKLPFMCDDFFLFAHVSGNSYTGDQGFESTYDFIDPRAHRDYPQLAPWWTSPDTKLRFLRPLSGLSLKLDYLMWKRNPLGYHLTNLLIHGVSCIFLFLIGRQLSQNNGIAFLGVLVFTNHFSGSFVVPWVADRISLLSLLFWLMGLHSHIHYRQTDARRWEVLGWLAFILAFLSRESGAISVSTYFFYDFFIWREQQPEKWPGIIRHGCYYLVFCVPLVVFVVYFILRGYGVAGYYTVFNEGWPLAKLLAYIMKNVFLYLSALLYVFVPISDEANRLMFHRLDILLPLFGMLLGAMAGSYPVLKAKLFKEGTFRFLLSWALVTLIPIVSLLAQNRHLYAAAAPFGLFMGLYLRAILRSRAFARYTPFVCLCLGIYFAVLPGSIIFLKSSAFEKAFNLQTRVVRETAAHLQDIRPGTPVNVFFINMTSWLYLLALQHAFDFYEGKGVVRTFPLTLSKEVPDFAVVGERQLRVSARSTPFLESEGERLFMTKRLNQEGLVVSNPFFSTTIERVEDGHIKAIRFDFTTNLDDRSMRFFIMKGRQVVPVSLLEGSSGKPAP